MNAYVFSSFSDELVKIALLKEIGSGLKTVFREGWHGTAAAPNPLWSKGLMVVGTGLGAKAALGTEDPTGQGRGRAERTARFAAGTVGGLAGTSAMLRLMPKHPLIGGLIGGIGGSVLGEKAVSAPWAVGRKLHPVVKPMGTEAISPASVPVEPVASVLK